MSAPAYPPTIKTLPLARDGSLSFWWYPATQAPDTFGYNIYDQNSTLLASVTSTLQTTTVTGLSNGQTYSCWLTAANIAGESPPAFFRPFQPGVRPTQAPLSAVATAVGSNSASITWSPSGETPVAPIQWYSVKAISSDPAVSTFRYTTDGTVPITSLFETGFNQYSYQFAIQAVNCPGYGPAALTNSINFAPVFAGGSWAFQKTDFNETFTVTPSSSLSFTPGTSAFTFESFLYLSQLNNNTPEGKSNQVYLRFSSSGLDGFALSIEQEQSSKGSFSRIVVNGPGQYTLPSVLTSNIWYHIACARDSSSNFSVWLNGTRVQNMSNNDNDYFDNPEVIFSGDLDGDGTLSGYATNLNFISGSNRYDPTNASITVPTAPFTVTSNTAALWLATSSGTVWDDATGNNTIDTTTGITGGRVVWASNSPF
jgi:hypothetical protein